MIFPNSGFFLYDENTYNEKQKSSKCMLKLLHHKRKMTSFCFSENDIHRNLKYRAITKISYWHYVISRDSDDEINSQLRRYLSTWSLLLLRYFLWVKFVFYKSSNHMTFFSFLLKWYCKSNKNSVIFVLFYNFRNTEVVFELFMLT